VHILYGHRECPLPRSVTCAEFQIEPPIDNVQDHPIEEVEDELALAAPISPVRNMAKSRGIGEGAGVHASGGKQEGTAASVHLAGTEKDKAALGKICRWCVLRSPLSDEWTQG
jgi:hypothetical protein